MCSLPHVKNKSVKRHKIISNRTLVDVERSCLPDEREGWLAERRIREYGEPGQRERVSWILILVLCIQLRVTRLFELTDTEWQLIAPLLPGDPPRGGRWRDHRQVVNGILWRIGTGAPWRDIPDRYGPWQTLHKRFRRWRVDGTWARIEAALQMETGVTGEVVWSAGMAFTAGRGDQSAGSPRRRVRPARRWADRDGIESLDRTR